MTEFISSIRTTHLVLIGITVAVLAFALSPRDADEYRSAQLEAQFVSEMRSSGYYPHRGSRLAISSAVSKVFVAYGLNVAPKFSYSAPIIYRAPSRQPTFSEVAELSADFSA